MANLLYLAKIKKVDGREIKLELAEDLNVERLKTVYSGYAGARYCELRMLDPRSFSVDQRKYYYALLGDISAFTGHFVEEIDDNVRWKFKALTGRTISLSNGSENTKDDVVLLTNIALDLAFELNVALSNKIPIPDKNLEYYFYKCITCRKCCICGKKADIHHVDTVGMGGNRRKVDNSWRKFEALCREHHQMIDSLGQNAVDKKFHIYGITLNDETIKRLGI